MGGGGGGCQSLTIFVSGNDFSNNKRKANAPENMQRDATHNQNERTRSQGVHTERTTTRTRADASIMYWGRDALEEKGGGGCVCIKNAPTRFLKWFDFVRFSPRWSICPPPPPVVYGHCITSMEGGVSFLEELSVTGNYSPWH